MTTPSRTNEAAASTLWIMLLTLAGLGVTALLSCATPFTALAALAATQMRRRDAIALMVTTWVASQAVAFAVHHYPASGNTLGWAGTLGVAAVAATLAARAADDRLGTGRAGGGAIGRLLVAYLVAMVAFKAVVLLGALALSGGAAAFAPSVLLREFVRNGAILIGLYALYNGLVTIGLPAARRDRLAAA